ncbi:MAG: hypothetical protein HY876_07970 [Coriobacteriales bacterium]|nr:hypothetical protein [Coriobacteriales bacterium]
MNEDAGRLDDALIDLESMSNEELRELLDDLYAEEQRVSYRRRVLHGKIDILRAELVRRLQAQTGAGTDVITGRDVSRLVDILSNELRGVSRFDVTDPSLEGAEGDTDSSTTDQD